MSSSGSSFAAVRHRDGDPVAAVLLSLVSSDGDGVVLSELVGVAHEVLQCLTQAHLVGMDRPDAIGTMDRNLVRVFGC